MARTAKNSTPAETDAPALDLQVGTEAGTEAPAPEVTEAPAPEVTAEAPAPAPEGEAPAPEGDKPEGEAPAGTPEPPAGSIDMSALLAQASNRDTSYGESRSKKVRGPDGKPVYGVFETPDGHIVAINRDALGRETDWSLFRLLPGGKLAHVGNFRRKVDALDHLDAQRLAAPVVAVTADPELDAAVAAAAAEVGAEESVTA